MTTEEIDTLRELAKAATPGPWKVQYHGEEGSYVYLKCFPCDGWIHVTGNLRVPIAELIVALRNAAPDLLEAAKELAAACVENERLKHEIATDSWTGEIQRALDFIPKEYLGNDAWENGVSRMADALAERDQSINHLFAENERLKVVESLWEMWCEAFGDTFHQGPDVKNPIAETLLDKVKELQALRPQLAERDRQIERLCVALEPFAIPESVNPAAHITKHVAARVLAEVRAAKEEK